MNRRHANIVLIWGILAMAGCRRGGLDNDVAPSPNAGPVQNLENPNPTTPSEPNDTLSLRSLGQLVATHGNSDTFPNNRFIYWGGVKLRDDGSPSYESGGGWMNPKTGKWRYFAGNRAPTGRIEQGLAWTGKKLLVWGGEGGALRMHGGGLFDHETDTWTPMATSGLDAPRSHFSGLWVGSGYFVWGGCRSCDPAVLWDEVGDSWSVLPLRDGRVGTNDVGFYVPAAEPARMVLFGGTNESGNMVATLAEIGIKPSPVLTVLSEGGGPEPRLNASVSGNDDHIYVGGGNDGKGKSYTDIWDYSRATASWKKVVVPSTESDWSAMSYMAVVGDRLVALTVTNMALPVKACAMTLATQTWNCSNSGAPLAARGVTIGAIDQTRLIYMGGERQTTPRYDDAVWTLDLATMNWTSHIPGK